MKKIIACILALLLVCFSLCSCNEAVNNDAENNQVKTDATEDSSEIFSDVSYYNQVVQERIYSIPNDDYSRGYATLYDVDSNGVKELIMIYDSDTVQHPDSPLKGMGVAYDIYTINGSDVVELEKEHFLFPLAGGPTGTAYILENNSETYLAFRYSEINPNDNDLCCLGNWYIYSINGDSIELVKEVEYSYNYTMDGDKEVINYTDSVAKSKDYIGAYDWFHKWLSGYKHTEILSYSDKYSDNELEKFIETL